MLCIRLQKLMNWLIWGKFSYPNGTSLLWQRNIHFNGIGVILFLHFISVRFKFFKLVLFNIIDLFFKILINLFLTNAHLSLKCYILVLQWSIGWDICFLFLSKSPFAFLYCLLMVSYCVFFYSFVCLSWFFFHFHPKWRWKLF